MPLAQLVDPFKQVVKRSLSLYNVEDNQHGKIYFFKGEQPVGQRRGDQWQWGRNGGSGGGRD